MGGRADAAVISAQKEKKKERKKEREKRIPKFYSLSFFLSLKWRVMTGPQTKGIFRMYVALVEREKTTKFEIKKDLF